jgi:hypothetical protein
MADEEGSAPRYPGSAASAAPLNDLRSLAAPGARPISRRDVPPVMIVDAGAPLRIAASANETPVTSVVVLRHRPMQSLDAEISTARTRP